MPSSVSVKASQQRSEPIFFTIRPREFIVLCRRDDEETNNRGIKNFTSHGI
jgi:hypothetical protein